jgi:methionyl-tRNA formyltransferase
MMRVDLLIGDDVHSQIVAKTFTQAALKNNIQVGVWSIIRKENPHMDFHIARWRKIEISILPALLASQSQQAIDRFFVATGAVEASHVPNVNAASFVQNIANKRPDFVVSVRCYQKLASTTINAFNYDGAGSRLLNLHPGRLPQYRGVMTLLHQLLAKDLSGPSSLHQVSPNWDEGPLLGVSNTVLEEDRSLLSNYMRSGFSGAAFLMAELHRYKANGIKAYLNTTQNQSNAQARYFSGQDAVITLNERQTILARLSEMRSDIHHIFNQALPPSLLNDPEYADS